MDFIILLVSILGDLAVAALVLNLAGKRKEEAQSTAPSAPAVQENAPVPEPEKPRKIGEIVDFGKEKYVLLRGLVSGRVQDAEQLQEALRVTGLFGGVDGPCAAIVFRIKNAATTTLGQVRRDVSAWNALLAQSAETIIGAKLPCETVYGNNGEAIVVVSGVLEQREMQEMLINACTRVLEDMQSRHHLTFSCGIGVCIESMLDLPHSLTSAQLACEYRLFFGEQSVTRYQDIEYRNSVPYRYPDEEESNILKYMKQANGLRAEQEIAAFFKAIEITNVRSVELCIHNLMAVICRFIKMSGELDDEELDYYYAIDRIEQLETIYEKMQEINALVQTYINHASQKRFEKNDGTIEEIVQFMEQNYHNPTFSIMDLEEHMHYSGNHIRNLFKDAYQCTPMEYLLQLRIRKAKELLATTDMKAVNIAEQVGYENSKYFYSLFKKHTGMTTYEYRVSVQNGTVQPDAADEEGQA